MTDSEEWVEGEAVVASALGLHVRPARIVWERARRFSSDIRIRKGRRDYDVKSIFDIMALDASRGTALTVRAKGDDARRAVAVLVALIGTDLDAES
ncbi:MAG TPA: HPr family phosphocarrier protein [Planctomycetota bacterium]|nr:HPr family phosphocarrier protein [Planctomycetota bacterium]